jgi:rubrerythrin
MEFKESKTEKNLKASFIGESQARNKYTYFAEVAREEGHLYIAKIFEEAAENEKQHAKDEFKLLGGISDTATNLKKAIDGEHYETITMYPDFAKEAEEEGFKDAARLFKQITRIEKEHHDRYKKLLEMVENGTVYKRETPIRWKCSKCGYVIEAKEPPPKCPCCQYPREFYEPECMSFV